MRLLACAVLGIITVHQISPVLTEDVISDHAQHAEREGQRETVRNIVTADKLCDQEGRRNTHCPQHHQIDERGVFYPSRTVDDAGDAVEYRIHPLAQQHDYRKAGGHRKNLRVRGKAAQDRLPDQDKQQSEAKCNQSV